MASPYGIQNIDVPGMLNTHNQLKRQRLEDLYMQRKLAKEDRELAKEEKRAGIVSRLFTQPKPAETASQAEPVTPSDEPVYTGGQITPQQFAAAEQYDNPNAAPMGNTPPAMAEQPTPQAMLDMPNQRPDGLTINREALAELMKEDPVMGMKFYDFAAKADKAQLEKVAVHGEAKAKAATYLLDFAPGPERQAAFERIIPNLLQQGFTQQDINSAILSDDMLRKDMVMGQTMAGLVSQQNSDRSFEAAETARREAKRRADIAEARAARAEGRAVVRHNERGLDRDAISRSGGVRSDLSDLDY